jgi:hypothetical protein
MEVIITSRAGNLVLNLFHARFLLTGYAGDNGGKVNGDKNESEHNKLLSVIVANTIKTIGNEPGETLRQGGIIFHRRKMNVLIACAIA